LLLKASNPETPLNLDLGEDRGLCEGETFYLYLKGFAGYEWQNGSTDSTFLVTEPGVYYVKAFDRGGHQQIETLHVEVCFESTIPNVITPNGDADNEFFVIEKLDLSKYNTLFIYDRWGKKVFSSSSYQNNWNGAGLSTGTYLYELQNASDRKIYKGWLQVLR
jgi:gliding motility-associated-like protein